jgi:hypothetical protein
VTVDSLAAVSAHEAVVSVNVKRRRAGPQVWVHGEAQQEAKKIDEFLIGEFEA